MLKSAESLGVRLNIVRRMLSNMFSDGMSTVPDKTNKWHERSVIAFSDLANSVTAPNAWMAASATCLCLLLYIAKSDSISLNTTRPAPLHLCC